jgi:hypothetical protein
MSKKQMDSLILITGFLVVVNMEERAACQEMQNKSGSEKYYEKETKRFQKKLAPSFRGVKWHNSSRGQMRNPKGADFLLGDSVFSTGWTQPEKTPGLIIDCVQWGAPASSGSSWVYDFQMKIIRNNNSHRQTFANDRKTQERVEQYYGKVALLNTWEQQSEDVQVENHDYIIELRRHMRTVKNYLLHRNDSNAHVV